MMTVARKRGFGKGGQFSNHVVAANDVQCNTDQTLAPHRVPPWVVVGVFVVVVEAGSAE